MFTPFRARFSIAFVALAACSSLAQAEGDHNLEGFFLLIAYILGAALVMLGQGIYALCLPRARWAVKFMCLIALAGVDLIAVLFMISAFGPESAIGYVLVVIPGFVFLCFITMRVNRAAQAGLP